MATYTLQVGGDAIDGTSDDDIFVVGGNIERIQGTDLLRGGAGADTILFQGSNISFSANRLAGTSSVEVLNFEAATSALTVSINAAAVAQAAEGTLTLRFAQNAMTLDTSAVGVAGRVVLDGTGAVTLRNFEGQAVQIYDGTNGNVQGGNGADLITGSGGNDTLSGNLGDDDLFGGSGSDVLSGGDGNDYLAGGAGDDTLTGGAGHDLLETGSGTGGDVLTGGAGSDTFRISAGAGQVSITDFATADTMERIDLRGLSAVTDYADLTLTESVTGLRITAEGLNLFLADVTAAAFNARPPGTPFIFTGDATQSMAEGLTIAPDFRVTAGKDTYVGTSGDNVIEVSGNIESLNGSDTIGGGNGLDTLRFLGTSLSLDQTRFAGLNSIERLDVSSAQSALTLRLSDANVQQADNGILTVFHGGNDMLLDVSTVAHSSTVVVEGTGTVTLRNFDGQDLTISDAYGGTVSGGTGKDKIVGGAKNDWIEGGGNNDTLSGGAGSDHLSGQDENDTLHGGSGNDVLKGDAGNDTLFGDEGNDRISGGAGEDELTGGAGDDVLTGDVGNDHLYANAGNDHLEGGDGEDIYVIGQAAGSTKIVDFAAGTLAERIDLRAFSEVVSFDDLSITDTVDGAVIQFSGSSVTLAGVAKADVSPTQFIFSGQDELTYFVEPGTTGAQIQNLLDTAPRGAVISFGAGTFTLNEALNINRGDITVQGAGSGLTTFVATMSGASADSAFKIESKDLLMERSALLADADIGDTQITVEDASDIHVGGFIYIGQPNDAAYLAETGNSGWTPPAEAAQFPDQYVLRETIVEVVSKVGNVLTLAHGLPYHFDAQTAKVSQGDFLQNVHIGGFQVKTTLGTANPLEFENVLGNDWTSIPTIDFDQVAHSSISDVLVTNAGSHGIKFQTSYEVTGDGLTVRGAHNKGDSGNGYGIYLNEAFNNTLTNVKVFDTRHGLLTSSNSAEHYNVVHITDTNRDINFHGGPDSGNIFTVDRMVQDYGDSPSAWASVGPGSYPIHPRSTIDANAITFGYLQGEKLSDTAHGFDTGSTLNGGDGDDFLYGGLSVDTINGEQGNDTLSGGGGRDVFLRTFGDEDDAILDFQVGAAGDVIKLTGYAVQSFGSLFMTQVGADTVIDFGQDGSLTLKNVEKTGLVAANFAFLASSMQQGLITSASTPLVMGSDQSDTLTLGRSTLTNGSLIYGGAGIDRVVASVGSFTGTTASFSTFSSIEQLDFRAATSLSLTVTDAFLNQSSTDTLELLVGDTSNVSLNIGTPAAGLRLVVTGGSLVQFASSSPQTAYGGDSVGVRFTGGSSADILTGGAKADRLIGGSGNDILEGRGGLDTFDGGIGSDTVQFSLSATGVIIDFETAARNAGDAAGEVYVSIENITGSAFADDLSGDGGDNVLNGSAGNDTLFGRAGNDTLIGGAGADTMTGGAGDDLYIVDDTSDVVVESAAGGIDTVQTALNHRLAINVENVTLTGSASVNASGNNLANILIGNSGANTLEGGAGADTMSGSTGNDTYAVDNAGDKVIEFLGQGTDTIVSTVSYSLAADQQVEVLRFASSIGAANANLTGNNLVNTLIGTAGNNVLNGGGNADIMRGQSGNDTYAVDSQGDQVIEAAGQGSDTIVSTISYTLAAGQEVEFLQFASSVKSAGGSLTGNEFANTLSGTLGNNTLNGGGGADILKGFAGNDTYAVDQQGDQVIEDAGQGSDTIVSTVSYMLTGGQEVEFLQFASSIGGAHVNLTGNEFSNTLTGTAGSNILSGGGGADILKGLAGNDTYLVDNAGDQIMEAVNGGTDTLTSSVTYMLAADQSVEVLQLATATGSAALNLTGNNIANTIDGNLGNNVLNGGGGADVLRGLAGNDTYAVDSSADQVIEVVGQGTDTVISTASYTLAVGQSIEFLQLASSTGAAALNLFGNEFSATLVGNGGVNVLDGKAGNDILTGKSGSDTFSFSSALGPNNIDHVTDFSIADDTIQLSRSVFAALSAGALSATAFKDLGVQGATLDVDDRIVYDRSTGALSYDADGSGSVASVQFAVIDNKVGVNHLDFLIV